MASLSIGGNVSAGRDINIAQEGSQITNKYNDTIQEELGKHQELASTVAMLEEQLQSLLLAQESNNAIGDCIEIQESTQPTFVDNLKKIGAKSLDLATAVLGKVLQRYLP